MKYSWGFDLLFTVHPRLQIDILRVKWLNLVQVFWCLTRFLQRPYSNCKFRVKTKAHTIERAATCSTSSCGLAKSCDSYQWNETSDRKINTLLSSKVTSALKMSWLRGLAPAVIYLDMKSARMNTIGLTVPRTQEISGNLFSPSLDEWQPFLTSVCCTFMNVNETERRAA